MSSLFGSSVRSPQGSYNRGNSPAEAHYEVLRGFSNIYVLKQGQVATIDLSEKFGYLLFQILLKIVL